MMYGPPLRLRGTVWVVVRRDEGSSLMLFRKLIEDLNNFHLSCLIKNR